MMSKATRRTFMKAILAAGAVPAVIPSGVVRAQDGRPTPANRTTFALIGCGWMGPDGVFGNLIQNKDTQVIAGCDVFKSRREKFANRVNEHYGTKGCEAVADFQALLTRKDLDCVYIATPEHWHVAMAMLAIRNGKDVYVEKPLSTGVNWSRILRAEVQKRKAVFQFGTWQRSQRHFRKACEMVRNGIIGDVKRVETWSTGSNVIWGDINDPNSDMGQRHVGGLTPQEVPADLEDFDAWLGPAPAAFYSHARTRWYCVPDYCLGFISNWNIHPVDIAQWGLGTDHTVPVAYKGTCQWPSIRGICETPIGWDVTCRYANGIELRKMDTKTAEPIITQYRPNNDHGTTFFGEKGWLSVDRGTVYMSDRNIKWDKIEWKDSDTKLFASAQDNQWHGFIDSVRTRKPTVNPIESAFNGDLICHLASIAAISGREVKWDAKEEKLVGNADLAMHLSRTAREPWGKLMEG